MTTIAKSHRHFEKLRHRCRIVGQGNLLWNAVEKQRSKPCGPVDVPAHARRRSWIARENAVERSREEEEKRQRVVVSCPIFRVSLFYFHMDDANSAVGETCLPSARAARERDQ